MKFLGCIVALAAVAYTAASEEDHEHEEHPFELAAAFDIDEVGHYTWILAKEAGHEEGHDEHGHDRLLSEEDEEDHPEYAFDHNRIAVGLIAGACTEDSLEDFEEDAELFLNESATVVPEIEAGDVVALNTSTAVEGFELHVNELTFTSLWLFDVQAPGCLVLYSESPQEDGFFRNVEGEEVEPTFLIADGPGEFSGYSSDTWLVVLGAVALVSLTSFLGAVLLLCGLEQATAAITRNVDEILTFAAGIILGLCFFHLLPEAVEFNGGFDWEMSLALAVTFFLSVIVKMTFGGHEHDESTTILDKKEVEAEALATEEGLSLKKHSTSLNLLWGDFFCNFADGVVIAASFAICADSTLGWLLTGAIILHEAPQEISDLLVIYDDFGSIKIALCINICSACGAFVGAILVLGLGNISGQALGLLLAAGAMALIFVCLVEITPRVVTFPNKERAFFRLLLIIIGFVIMGLTILAESGHCEVGGEYGEAEVHSGH